MASRKSSILPEKIGQTVAVPSDSEYDPLDEDEQEEVVQELEWTQSKTNRYFRTTMLVLCMLCWAVYCVSALSHIFQPWAFQFQWSLVGFYSWGTVFVFQILGAFGHFAMGIFIYQFGPIYLQKGCAGVSLLVSLILACTLGYTFFSKRFPVHLAWFPFGNAVLCLLCCFIHWSLTSSDSQIASLRKYKYNFKKA
eukprot:GILJ01004511.1.p1 GENE.GILJ01004511.1~~GILJ01004511.1.p1  ORF type:complete len:209 (-),score=0.79 GILJ01004511.1:132-716(-)